ncbi:MAG: Hydrolase, alpha/beta fold family [uncultured Gemmatimonadaceae bacterium]|uniref:Hydrolase, alpha/beta fold family n=1 Tax=uncultured Gemmatimonadaceae bacterium TaxID=246130 RepID=A0A6J4LHB0_9BACT|nr:MAG: Hydrolase, alpha/beta fold family [uncultured Gemmatimonadaceae bacterium]
MTPVPNVPPTPHTPHAPAWLDTAAYPFRPRRFDTGEGALSYVDEGAGPPVVLVHGTPTWSFLYRRLIPRLAAAGHRVVAPDHLGFGLSDRPVGAGYRPEDHARRLAALLDALDLRDITLVVHDFGGPIGLSYALDRPERVARLVVSNTWLWPLEGDPRIARGARVAAGPLGRFLYLRLNASPRWLIPAGFADRARLTPAAHRQYLVPFPDSASRRPPWALARALLGSSAWYDGLWQRRARLRGKPALLLWGMRDPGFGGAYLARWREALPEAAVAELPGAGHFVQEEAAAEVAAHIETFLTRPAPGPRAGVP